MSNENKSDKKLELTLSITGYKATYVLLAKVITQSNTKSRLLRNVLTNRVITEIRCAIDEATYLD